MHPVYNLSHEAQHPLELASPPSCLWLALSRDLRAPNPGALWLSFLLLVSICLGISHRGYYCGRLFSRQGIGSSENGVIILHSWRIGSHAQTASRQSRLSRYSLLCPRAA